MTNIASVSDQGSIIDNADLPRPVDTSCPVDAGLALPRPVTSADVADSGRIRFGNGYRLPAGR